MRALASPLSARVSRLGRPLLGALTLFGLTAGMVGCGDDPPIEIPIPSALEARSYFGLTAGSCGLYRFAQGGIELTARTAVVGPDVASVAGREAFRWSFLLPSSTQPQDEWFVEGQDDGELRLLRSIETTDAGRLTRTYTCFGDSCPPADEGEPALLKLNFDGDDLVLDSRLLTTTTPADVSAGSPEAEEHRVNLNEETMLATPDGMEPGLVLQYSRRIGAEAPRVLVFGLVPGKGFATIRDGGTIYTACDWRTCDTDGNCEGPASCAELSCN